MGSLLEYDIVNKKIDKNKTWIDIKSKRIFTKEFIRPFTSYIIAKKFIPEENVTKYYIILGNNLLNSRKCILDAYGRMKIRIGDIWNDLGIDNILSNEKYQGITSLRCNFTHVDSGDNDVTEFDSYEIEVELD
jgi:hypothetical protein